MYYQQWKNQQTLQQYCIIMKTRHQTAMKHEPCERMTEFYFCCMSAANSKLIHFGLHKSNIAGNKIELTTLVCKLKSISKNWNILWHDSCLHDQDKFLSCTVTTILNLKLHILRAAKQGPQVQHKNKT